MSRKPLKIGCLLTVRTSSSRLPGKALLKIRGKRTIEHLIDRIKLAKTPDSIVLCTSNRPEDDILETIAGENSVHCFRGSLTDKLERWLGAIRKFELDYFITVDGDDLFCDPHLIDLAVAQLRKCSCDLMFTPPGLVCGAFPAVFCISAAALEKVCETKKSEETEMVHLFFDRTGSFKTAEFKVDDPIYFSRARLTLDYQEDLNLFRQIFEEFDMKNNDRPLKEILQLLNRKPELMEINAARQQDYLENQRRQS